MSETASLNKTPMSYWIHSAVYLFLTFGMGYIPTESISSLGMSIVGIFIGMLYGWTFIGFIWPSMMSIFAPGVCGYFDTPQLAFSNAFSNQLVIFMLLILVFTAYFERSGINKKIAAWFLSRPSVQGRPWFFTFMVLLATFVVGFLVDGNAVNFLIWNLLYGIFKEVDYREGENYPAYLCAGVSFAALLSYGCKPWGNANIMAIGALQSASGGIYSLNYVKFMLLAIPLCFLFLMGYFIVMKYIFKPDVKKLMSLSNDYLQQLRNDLTLNIKEKIAAGALLVFISILLLINILPSSSSGILGILSKGNFLSALIVILIALNFSRLEGGPILDFGGCAQKGIHWNVFWLNAAAMPVSAALSSDAAGITKRFGLMMNNYFIGVEAVVFIIAFTLLLLLATQVAFNMTLVVVAVPIVWQVCQTLGLNPLGVTVLILMAISCAIATPAASSNAAIMFSNVDWIGVPRSFKAGISAMLASMVILLGVGFPLVALIYGF